MRKPVVAIVGRPNVGKSTLFNLLAGRRISIVEPTAGVTRDRVTAPVLAPRTPGAKELDREIELLDTGGIGIVDSDRLEPHIEQQIAIALQTADVVVMVVSVRDGVTPLDEEIAGRLRAMNRPVVLVANKSDELQHEQLAGELYALGLGDPLPCSAIQGFGRSDLLDRLAEVLPAPEALAPPAEPPGVEPIQLAIVGKRNAGKSTFVNALAREERVIVSEIPGTTRDAVDVRFERDGEVFLAIDTAGMRKKRKVEHAIELFSQMRTEQAIDRADVVCLLFDVTEPLSQVDKHLSHLIETKKKPCVLVGNKWDLAREKVLTGEIHAYVQQELPGVQIAPLVFTTAIQAKGVWNVLQVAKELYEQAHRRIPTPELNRVIQEAIKVVRPRVKKTVPRIYFATQTDVGPPTIVLMVNKPALIDNQYRRYLINRIREACDMEEVPLELVLRERLTQYDPGERRERAQRKRRRRGRRADAPGGAEPPPQES